MEDHPEDSSLEKLQANFSPLLVKEIIVEITHSAFESSQCLETPFTHKFPDPIH